ncbi:MAG: tyrosine recombinase XerC [Polyangiaceae bacterium]
MYQYPFGHRRRRRNSALPSAALPKTLAPPAPPAAEPEPVVVVQEAPLSVARVFGPRDVYQRFLLNRSANTRDAYRRDFEIFAAWLKLETSAAAELLLSRGGPNANALALEWLDAMLGEGKSSATRARRLATLKSFTKAARLLGVIDWAIETEGPKVDAYLDTQGPGIEGVHRLFAACGEGLEGARNAAMLALFAGWGFRRKEIAAALVEDYDHERRRFFIRGKGDKNKWLELPPEVIEKLDAWVGAWEASHGPMVQGAALFRSLSPRTLGQGITVKGVYAVIREIGERAGMDIHPHAIRHTFVTTVLDESNGNTRMGQASARHADSNTTGRYDDARKDLGAEGARLAATALIPKDPK